ncbi:MAG: hypothetical protein A3A77_01305 [Candidatus Blackburnbacteria bacterium RIFCSPLOWO2_01_FULL_40_20]|uniref:Glycosyltransferase RgtA/B/C/D-like domain-containing protein n=1 Tax=Candidatus Blackburnbacteria bacterium RIFCSPLOWO2_01_FULL_40_20 TaxID=1797519 RepID=A0A1G1VEP7_9BACT|nr:MAG: hypothetical protein A3A77_01305 [Candidatus Blackburnbacteria bacterium RIFCSPLOWO2_01_FULL_40_20]
MEGLMKQLKAWIAQNKFEFLLLLLIISAATAVRLWNIGEYLPFMGDEGRDVRVVRKLVTEGDLVFIGPRTSIGNMYLGPLYYYLMAPSLILSDFSPVGPAVFVALLGVVTVWMVWFVTREWFGKRAAIIASLLYSLSPIVILLSRHSWNPNVMPFFALGCVFSVWRLWQKKMFTTLVPLGIFFAFVLQSHYLGLLLLPTLAVTWFLALLVFRKAKKLKSFFGNSLLGLSFFILLMSPLALFDSKHGWGNFGAIKTFFTDRQSTVSIKPWNAIGQIGHVWNDLFITRIVTANNQTIGIIVSLFIVIGLVLVILKYRQSKNNEKLNASLLLTGWMLAGIVGLALYKQSIYDHYFGFLFPAPFIAVGVIASKAWEGKLKLLVIAGVAVLLFINLQKNPLKFSPQRQLQRTQEIDKSIVEKSEGKPFNFGLIAKTNYEEGYLYFFELWNVPVKEIDAQNVKETITDQLFVACEDSVCEPINNPKAEIAGFGWAKVESQWEVSGIKIFKLVHATK